MRSSTTRGGSSGWAAERCQAAAHGWAAAEVVASLAAGAALIAAFGVIESRAASPILPLRILADRNRGGAYLSVLIAGSGMFGIFLFLTYYMQGTLGFSPVVTGVAFLPMIALVVIFANVSNVVLMPRVGPRAPVVLGMLLAACAMAWLKIGRAHV